VWYLSFKLKAGYFSKTKIIVMQRFTLLLFSILYISLSSCKTFHLSSVPKGAVIENKLPPLVPEFDYESFAVDYQDIYPAAASILTGRPPNINTAIQKATTQLMVSEDTKLMFEGSFIKDITNRVGKNSGYIVCRKGMRTKGIKSHLNPVVSILTLGLANVFGYKYATYVDELEIVVDVYNNDNDLIASYNDFGKGTADVRMYKGYSGRGARRLAHAKAFAHALEGIKDQINGDQKKISALLYTD